MTAPTLQSIIQAGDQAYRALSKFETSRFKILQHCNLLPLANLNYSPPNTRASNCMYTVKLTCSCTVCHDRHIEIGHKSYLLHFASLPFKCEHGHPITNLHVQEGSERTLPFIDIPSKIRKVAPPCLSESSGGAITPEKLLNDKKRIKDTFSVADEAFTTLAAQVNNSNLDLSEYPQYGTDHINCLLAALENYVDECVGYLDGHIANLVQLSDVSEADDIEITPSGELNITSGRGATAQVNQDPNPLSNTMPNLAGASVIRSDTPILDRPNPETETGSRGTLTPGSANEMEQLLA